MNTYFNPNRPEITLGRIRVQKNRVLGRDVNILIFLDFSIPYDSVLQKYLRLKRYVAHYEILWYRVALRNEFFALEYLIQR